MQHPARRRNAKIGFEMRVMVPHECSHPFAALQSCFLKRLGQCPRTPIKVAVGIAVQRFIGQSGNDFDLAKKLARTFKKMGQRQRVIHHLALHKISTSKNFIDGK